MERVLEAPHSLAASLTGSQTLSMSLEHNKYLKFFELFTEVFKLSGCNEYGIEHEHTLDPLWQDIKSAPEVFQKIINSSVEFSKLKTLLDKRNTLKHVILNLTHSGKSTEAYDHYIAYQVVDRICHADGSDPELYAVRALYIGDVQSYNPPQGIETQFSRVDYRPEHEIRSHAITDTREEKPEPVSCSPHRPPSYLDYQPIEERFAGADSSIEDKPQSKETLSNQRLEAFNAECRARRVFERFQLPLILNDYLREFVSIPDKSVLIDPRYKDLPYYKNIRETMANRLEFYCCDEIAEVMLQWPEARAAILERAKRLRKNSFLVREQELIKPGITRKFFEWEKQIKQEQRSYLLTESGLPIESIEQFIRKKSITSHQLAKAEYHYRCNKDSIHKFLWDNKLGLTNDEKLVFLIKGELPKNKIVTPAMRCLMRKTGIAENTFCTNLNLYRDFTIQQDVIYAVRDTGQVLEAAHAARALPQAKRDLIEQQLAQVIRGLVRVQELSSPYAHGLLLCCWSLYLYLLI